MKSSTYQKSKKDDLIEMSVSAQFTPADKKVKRIVDPQDVLPRVHLEESIDNLASQLIQFKHAQAKSSTIDLVEDDFHRSSIPKIGEKISKLSDVSTGMIKRYQLARAARVEASRRLKVCDRIDVLRKYVDSDADFKPKRGQLASRRDLRNRVAFSHI